jgi:hypothetical protein
LQAKEKKDILTSSKVAKTKEKKDILTSSKAAKAKEKKERYINVF